MLKKLLKRRIPQIIGSYLFGATSLVIFIDWLVARYQLPDIYVTISLFCLIAIIPSVFILAYFHTGCYILCCPDYYNYMSLCIIFIPTVGLA